MRALAHMVVAVSFGLIVYVGLRACGVSDLAAMSFSGTANGIIIGRYFWRAL